MSASGEPILGMFGEWGAGFASGVSGGFLTDVYEYSTGNKVEPNHAMLYNAGNVTGISVSFITGMKAASWATTAMGPLKWVGVGLGAVDTAFDGYGAATATSNLNQSYQDNGKFEVEDSWNLLAYVPFGLAAIKGIKGVLGASNLPKNGIHGVNDVLGDTQKTITKAGNCFVAGTEILTTEGIKNIEDIRVGDWVIADDPTTPGGIVAKQVLETFVRETDALVDLYVDGEVISTTGEHPFWVPDKGWVEAKDLVVGSLLQTEDGRVVDVDGIEKREGHFEVYNFKVEGFHTYFVSDLGVLVHNADYSPGTYHDAPRPLTDEEALSHGLQVHNRPSITKTRGAHPGPTGTAGHSQGKHNFPKDLELDIINNPGRIFIGINDNSRQVTVFYRDGDAVLTQNNDFSRVITAHGRHGRSEKDLDPNKWAQNPNYVEIIP